MVHQISYEFALVFRPHTLPLKIYINRLGASYNTDFHSDGLLDTGVHSLVSAKHLHFRNR